MNRVAARDYAGPADFVAMQRLTQRCWTVDGLHHVGGLAWQRFEHIRREAERPTKLWVASGEAVAWGWIYQRQPDLLYFEIHPSFPDLASEVLNWFEATATSNEVVVEVTNWQAQTMEFLAARGYVRRPDGPFGLLTMRPLKDLPPLELPKGCRAVSMAAGGDVDRRSAAHRAAWTRIAGRETAPPGLSRVTGESYRNVMAAWPYCPQLDWIVEAPDGRWVATCCAWLDAQNAVGQLEPVGVDADFRRQGLGRAVCLAALHALAGAGATRAIVGARGDDDYPVPRRLYFGLGFQTYARIETYVRARIA